ncbi:hypothetical protein M5689_016590 [Euphorbia peplus]|nr:hypothetical protein M5689_016590 [Euphorbia peplus]
MSFMMIGKNQPAPREEENLGVDAINNNNSAEDKEEEAEMESAVNVSRHIQLKTARSTEKLNKEVVLRRIRQRKRVNKVRAALQGFVGGEAYSASSMSSDNVPIRWVDDAFAAP